MLKWGNITLSITTADMNALLNEIVSAGISLYEVKILDALTVNFTIDDKSAEKVAMIAEKSGSAVKKIWYNGFVFRVRQVLRRPVLLVGILLWLFLILYLPSRVLFVKVEGNYSTPSLLIEETAAKHGISFGSARKDIRNEKIKNALLAEIPNLQWVGVNTQGCLAIITVRERTTIETAEKSLFVGHIIASQDGIIRDITVTKGTQLCKTGQAVTKNQVLVSGYTDCGLVVRAEVAAAEIVAVTKRELTVRQFESCTTRKQIIDIQSDYGIQIGKNIVKLSNRAGIPDGNCVKIYEQKYLVLPGGFRLPLALICEKIIRYDQTELPFCADEQVQAALAEAYLGEQMLAGHIVSSLYRQVTTENRKTLRGIYICEEIIGILRKEEIGI